LGPVEILLDGQDAKKVLDQLKPHFPVYAFFRSDRSSQDGDGEVQDPLKVAVLAALQEVQPEIQRIQDVVRERATAVAARTLEKLNELDSRLASSLTPEFKTEPKLDKLFSFSLTGDDTIPINKRGSGVRRLVLISFFRAQAEERRRTNDTGNVVYAIEEPETSQNPLNQRMLIESLLDLSIQDGIQVLLTTHTPSIARLIPSDALVHVSQTDEKIGRIETGEPVFSKIAAELGVTADVRTQVLLFVEGPTDVTYLRRFSELAQLLNPRCVNLADDSRVAVVPLGGSTLGQWVENRYLNGLHLAEVHVYDRGDDKPAKYQHACDRVNARGDGSWAVLTAKREIENYLHSEAVEEVYGVAVTIDSDCSVPTEVALAVRRGDANAQDWDQLSDVRKKEILGQYKKRLCAEVLVRMTPARMAASDPEFELQQLFERIGAMLHD